MSARARKSTASSALRPKSGAGVLLVSSDLGELLSLCDRISVVVDGRIVKTVESGSLGNAEELHHMIQLSQSLKETLA